MATQKVTIRLRGDHLNPPIYVAGSFTKEAWVPVEMEAEKSRSEDTKAVEATFYKSFSLAPGVYLYKFRLGNGDWWICDEDSEIVKDDSGNSNNRLVVLPVDDNSRPNGKINKPTMALPGININELLKQGIISRQAKTSSGHSLAAKDTHLSSLPQAALETPEPDSLIFPLRRRFSDLGIPVSNEGLLRLPTPDHEGEELTGYFTNEAPEPKEDIEAPPASRDNSSTSSKISNDSSDESYEVSKVVGTSTAISKRKGKETCSNVPSLDRILESPPEMSLPVPIEAHLSKRHGIVLGKSLSYGTITTDEPLNKKDKQGDTQYVDLPSALSTSSTLVHSLEAPNSETPLLEDSQENDHLSEPITEQKKEGIDDTIKPKRLTFLAVIVSYLRGIWQRLTGIFWKDSKESDRAHD